MKKLYLVKREVYANSIGEALHKDGEIYSIELALDQPDKELKAGFTNEKNRQQATHKENEVSI